MRLELSNRTHLAKLAMEQLASDGSGQPVKGGDLAAAVGTTRHYLPQVMRPLVAPGWVASEPGPSGGYRLTDSGRRTTLLQLIEAVEGPIVNGRCVLRGAACPPSEPCALHETWSRARSAMVAELGAVRVIPIPPRNQNPKKGRP